MRLLYDDGEYGLITSDTDRDIARAAASAAQSLRELTDTVGLTAERGECGNCGETATLRPVAAADDAGTPMRLDVCLSCQVDLVDRQLEAARGGGEDA